MASDNPSDYPTPMEQIGSLAMSFIENMEKAYPDGFDLGTIMICADFNCTEDGQTSTKFSAECSDDRRWVQVAFIEEVTEFVERVREASECPLEIEDDDE